jgi:hypothetical protein
VILLEKDLHVLADGVTEGRRICANTMYEGPVRRRVPPPGRPLQHGRSAAESRAAATTGRRDDGRRRHAWRWVHKRPPSPCFCGPLTVLPR